MISIDYELIVDTDESDQRLDLLHARDGVDGRYWCSRRYGRLRIGHDHDRGVQALPDPTPSLTAKADQAEGRWQNAVGGLKDTLRKACAG